MSGSPITLEMVEKAAIRAIQRGFEPQPVVMSVPRYKSLLKAFKAKDWEAMQQIIHFMPIPEKYKEL